MASPIGHALAGFAVGRLGERRAAKRSPADLSPRALWIACAVLAVAPDFDFLPGILVDRPSLFHQTASHSLLAALAVGFVTAIALSRDAAQFRRAWCVLSAAYASHLLIDWFGTDIRPPIGMPLFWPFSDATFLSPWTLLPGIQHADSPDTDTRQWLVSLISAHNLHSILLEVAVTAPLAAFSLLWSRRAATVPPSAAAESL